MPGYELFGEAERKEVNEVLETGILMRYGFDGSRKGIWKAKELENEISKKLKVRYTQLTTSGTSALTTAMAALGIGAGHEVIMPTFTFVASFESIFSAGAIPVLVDVDDTLTLDPKAVEAAITPNTKAVMPVHMCGAMADMDALKAICEKHNLLLLEDACQSFGASYKGKALGTIGHAGTFSFDFVKTITCAEGGAVVTNDADVYTKCDGYTDHGHDHLGVDRGADQHPFLGYNYRISELHAAVGLAQVRRLDDFLAVQKAHKKILKDAVATIPEVTFRRLPDAAGDSATFLSFFLPTEQTARKAAAAIKAAGIPAFFWFDNNWHYIRQWQHFKQSAVLTPFAAELQQAMEVYKTKEFPASDAIIGRCISTPINLAWTEEETIARAEKLVKAIKDSL
ncbi:8-amino-3,8-dideoxy-alpha-D-manno-octulosonate transaminase [Chitinophaga costaii]|uniref:8-amino-3,8-dideoxy-alpha-D-manno-octulosonate transaminase n=1 Tax=Chitinophaga costaii TaxID=1335309 RepID=A0A1C4AEB5_9BACT|nr:DegT/DnrJ/EryC1/StrS family aminotransferase [Chitinophaga costaii]PUZ26570.1 DegT/DnrJ/EryC1/StrS family aminotransferase [Chitinophaga costaii]SCB92897.1 8-amino-3,8-dideoxy-alpha-D-manno-octulosonate transaminase [Chitinophaga costaii]